MLLSFLLIACGDHGVTSLPSSPSIDPSERFPGGTTTNTLLLGVNSFFRPVSNLSEAHESSFYAGNSFFNQAWVQAPASTTIRDGLGPFFNARACSSCHPKDGRGAPPLKSEEEFLGLLLRLSIPGKDVNGGPQPHPIYGGQFQQNAILGVPVEGTPVLEYEEISGQFEDGEEYTLLKPNYRLTDLNYGPIDDDIMISPRVGAQVIGMGLLEAIPESRLQALSDPKDTNKDGISGRINMVWDSEFKMLRPGRFGWKGDSPSLRLQVASAFAGDIGITSPLATEISCGQGQTECEQASSGGEPEINSELFDMIVLYTSLVAVPIRRSWEKDSMRAGWLHFRDLGCDGCHVPSHETGEHEFEELRNQTIWPYTDLLLHDMGAGLSDDRPVFLAEGNEWRTPPLWGIGLIEKVNGHTRLLHDGRARNITEAILWHGGEAKASQQGFTKLTSAEREQLILFIQSL